MSRLALLAIGLLLSASGVEGSCDNGTDEADDVLTTINNVRISVAKGELEESATLPAAKNMNQLAWNCDMESLALRALTEFSEPPTTKDILGLFGNSYGCLYQWSPDPTNITTAVTTMLNYDRSYFPKDDSKSALLYMSSGSGDNGDFQNLIRAITTEIGCTIKKYIYDDEEEFSVLCLTDQLLLMDDETVYEIRQPDDADCGCTTDAWCNPDTMLCEVTTTSSTTTTTTTSTTTTTTTTTTTPTTTTTTTTTPTTTTTTTTTPTTTTTTTPTTTTTTTTPTTTTTTTPTTTTTTTTPTTTTTTTPTTTTTTTTTPTTTTTTPAIQPSPNAVLPSATAGDTMCPDNYYMTDKLRLRILDMHNSRRSLLALGQVTKNTGAYLPAAANMRKLRYDCELEFAAIKFASQCPKIGSTEDTRDGQGENFYQLTETGVTSFQQAASKAVDSWWKVVQVYPSLGSAAKFRENHVGTAIISFTQMAWAATQYLGCSVVNCSPFYTTVCRYSPKGNIVGETVYAPGDFCTACPPDTQCNAALYLCAP